MIKQVHSEAHSFLYYELANRKFHKNFDFKEFDVFQKKKTGKASKECSYRG